MLFDHMKEYISRGWRLFPVVPRDKKPIIKDWRNLATCDAQKLREWWEQWPNANIGLACGPGSGIYVIDIDVDREKGIDGRESLKDFPDLPTTITQRTPRGGLHYLFKTDDPPANKNSFRPGIDIRSDGYYVVLSPSIHPNGGTYAWERDLAPGEVDLAEFPSFMRPQGKPKPGRALPWDPKPDPEPPKTVQKPAQDRPGATPILERASLYLRECRPAVQGSAGHDALLWAARAMVIGFELSDADALALLWDEYNPRCSPPWNREDPADRKDFERKVAEAHRTPGTKPPGWLLKEIGAANAKRDPADLVMGHPIAIKPRDSQREEQEATSKNGGEWTPFPLECLPDRVAEYVTAISQAHSVDPVSVALPVLAVIAAAMGNAFRLKLKDGFLEKPTLWCALVLETGSNKSGPIETVTAPMWKNVPGQEAPDILSSLGFHRVSQNS